MTDLSRFPITKRWPAEHPERIQLYSLPTPNGVKASIALEEMALPYEAHLVSFGSNDQNSPEFISPRKPASSSRPSRPRATSASNG